MGPFIQIESVKIDMPIGGKKIIKAKDYVEYLKGREIIKRAKEKAEQIVIDAEAAFEAEKVRGYELGMMEGKEKITEQIFDTVSKTVNYIEKAEKSIVEVVITALKKVMEDYDDKKLVVGVVKNALQYVRNQKQVTLRVSPSDAKAVEARLSEISGTAPTIGYIEVSADQRISSGGCIIESDMGIIDGSLEKQMSILETALKKSLGVQKSV